MVLIALFGALADYYTDTTDFVRETLQVYDKRTIYLEAGILSQAIRMHGKRDYDFKRSLIRLLSNGVMPSTRPEIVRKAIAGTSKEWETMEIVKKEIRTIDGLAIFENVPKGISPTKVAKFALGVSGKSIALSTRIRKRQYVDISARKLDSFSLDLNLTFRTIAPRFGGSGGGHPTAAGARIPKKHLTEFLNAVTKEVEAIP